MITVLDSYQPAKRTTAPLAYPMPGPFTRNGRGRGRISILLYGGGVLVRYGGEAKEVRMFPFTPTTDSPTHRVG